MSKTQKISNSTLERVLESFKDILSEEQIKLVRENNNVVGYDIAMNSGEIVKALLFCSNMDEIRIILVTAAGINKKLVIEYKEDDDTNSAIDKFLSSIREKIMD